MARPKKDPKEVRVPITAAVLPEIEAELQSIAAVEDRTKSAIAEKLLLRGLAAFRQDGKLNEETVPLKAPRTTTSSRPKPSRHDQIREALQAAMGSDGKKLSRKDQETIRKVLEQEGSDE